MWFRRNLAAANIELILSGEVAGLFLVNVLSQNIHRLALEIYWIH